MLVKFLLLIILTCTQAWGQTKHLLMIGGGGEPKNKSTTIFDYDLQTVGQFAFYSGEWNTRLVFNGGHAETEGIASNYYGGFSPAQNNFTAKNYHSLIDEYEKKILSGQIKSGDQVMIQINSHGAQRSSSELSHQVATAEGQLENYDTLGGPTVSLDRLKRLTELAQQKGVKLALIDMSCHSGSTLALANSNTCVIAATGPNHYSYGGGTTTFSGQFSAALGSGKTLEDVYLEARAGYMDHSFPMISTAAGLDVQAKLYDPLTPYMYYYAPQADKQSRYLESEVADKQQCRAELHLESLYKEIESLLSVVTDSTNKAAILDFKAAVNDYYRYLRELRNEMREVGFDQAEKRFEFCTDIKANPAKKVKKGKECFSYTVKELVLLDFNKIQDYFRGRANTGTAQDRASAQAVVQNLENAKKKKADLLASNPQYSQMEKFWEQFPDRQQKTYTLSSKVAAKQKKLYEMMYRQSTASGANPCRHFVL